METPPIARHLEAPLRFFRERRFDEAMDYLCTLDARERQRVQELLAARAARSAAQAPRS